ncbi:MAG: cupin domain-containing protein [Hyphomonas sp.]
MKTRRVVTGQDAAGRTIFLSDGEAPNSHEFRSVPGFVTTLAWTTRPDDGPRMSLDDPTDGAVSWLPPKGGTHLMVITFPPDSVMMSPDFDPATAGAEYVATMPDLAQRFEAEAPGMHQTDTVDYGVVLSGQIVLDLGNDQTRTLGRGDIIVQNATRHAWRNPFDQPATLAFVLIDTGA